MSEVTDSPSPHPEMLAHLGPLAALVGIWEGAEGVDISPAKDGSKETHFRERITFEPIGPVVNGPQTLYGLRYSTIAWPLQVMRCFIVPRGVVVNAGGTSEPNAKEFCMAADAGSEVYGILSNPFLEEKAKTVRYELTVTIHEPWKFSYKEDTQLQISGRPDVFHHTDQNTLKRS
jgi:hypothetical protein